MRAMALRWGLLLALAVCPAARAADLALDDFEGDLARWGKGLAPETRQVKEGRQSARWEVERAPHVTRTDIPHDWSEYGALAFWAYSERKTGSQIVLQAVSENPASEGGDYFAHYFRVDWEGWREFRLPLDRLVVARSPVGWHQVESIQLHGQGWGQEKPEPGTILCLDDLRLLERSPEEKAALRARREAVEKGQVHRMDAHDDVLDLFWRGGGASLEQWRPLEAAKPAEAGFEQAWHAAMLWVRPGARARWGMARTYDLEIAPYRELRLRCRVDKGARLSVSLTVDGKAGAATAAHEGTGAAVVVGLPLSGKRLQGVRLELEGAGGGAAERRSADIEWIALRRPEQPQAAAASHLTRGVMVSWERPSWGAPAYRVLRRRGSEWSTAAPAVPARRPYAFDFPPQAGEWLYAVAPAGDGGKVGTPVRVRMGGAPAPCIRRAPKPVKVDGRLEEWSAMPADTIRFAAPEGVVNGAADSPEDASATVRLSHDADHLYLAADVKDDVVRHTGARSWEGDGVVLLLLFRPPGGVGSGERYDLVLNYPAVFTGGGAAACLLEDRQQIYPADAKPAAPGAWAVTRTPGGYALEAALPLALLRERGFDPEAGGLGLGLSVYDADQREGATAREAAVSWNQRTSLYTPSEAAMVRWEP